MIPKVSELYQEGTFGEGRSMVRELPQRGRKKPLTPILEGETTTENTRDGILGCLIDNEYMKIGVYGMGGIGKTTVLEHVHNIMLKDGDDEVGRQFDKVIWITVSKDSSISRLQDKIARELGLPTLNVDDDEENRATILYNQFKKAKNKRFALIIDDLWEAYPLKKVGVPEPTPENGCKLVITSRSHNVCSEMECEWIIRMGHLSKKETMNLFLNKVGKNVSSDPNLAKMVKLVARECAGLPLAIVTVAGSLRDKTDVSEWKVALTELKDATSPMSNKVMAILRFSYDRLKDETLKECLLYCALYPEDYLIGRDLLIHQLIAEGIFKKSKPCNFKMDKGRGMLNELVRNCLLIDAIDHKDKKCVKLHDSVRDMAMCIMNESPSKFLIKVRGGLDCLNLEEKWSVLVEKVSLVENDISAIPFADPPNCPQLSTLFLSWSRLENVAEDFFARMERLCVLDLSRTRIKRLPESVCSLTKLGVLLLNDCYKLIFIPDLSNLINLIRLDLSGTQIDNVPQGIEKLTKLMYLHLGSTEGIKSLPKVLLEELSDLESFSIFLGSDMNLSHARNFGTFKKLKNLEVTCMDFNFFITCMRSILNGNVKLENFKFDVGNTNVYFRNVQKKYVMMECNLMKGKHNLDLPILLPTNVENLFINNRSGGSLFDLVSIESTTNLRGLTIWSSFDSECLFYYSPAVFSLLQNIEELYIAYMYGLRGLVGTVEGNETAFPPLPIRAFSSLKKLTIDYCPNMKTLFVLAKDASLPNLEEIKIFSCFMLEEIIINETVFPPLPTKAVSSLKKVNILGCHKMKTLFVLAKDATLPNLEEIRISLCPMLEDIIVSENVDAIITLPSLKKLYLYYLPKLKSIQFIAHSLASVEIKNCPELKNRVLP